jgi:hypothetical protein
MLDWKNQPREKAERMQLDGQTALVTVSSVHGDASRVSYRCRHENGMRTEI